MSTEVAKQPQPPSMANMPIRQVLQQPAIADQIAKALPSHMTPDRFIRVALTAMTRTPKLADCTQASVMRCLLDCSAMGLEPDGRRAHLIPYKDQCTLIIDYKGLVELCRRSGDVSSIHADTVCENDVFEYDLGEIKRHTVDFRKPRGAVYAVYAMATLKDGSRQSSVLTREEVESVRSRSRAGTSGPWVTDWAEMAKKTAFRRLSKWLVLSPEIRDAFERDDDRAEIIEATPRIVQTTGSRTNDLAAMLTPQDDGGPTPEDLAGTVDHSADASKKVDHQEDSAPRSAEYGKALTAIRCATTREAAKTQWESFRGTVPRADQFPLEAEYLAHVDGLPK